MTDSNQNLFSFDYSTRKLKNRDEGKTKSRYSVVYGDGGNIMHCKKDSYHIIPTASVSKLGQTFVDKGDTVTPFSHRHGEVIGLNIEIMKNRKTKVGDKSYNAIITIPNNGGGRGYLSIKENRLICLNGWTRSKTIHAEKSIKIPHTFDYDEALELMEQAIVEFIELIEFMEAKDGKLNDIVLEKSDATRKLNEWFFVNEMPASHKKDEKGREMDLDTFRKIISTEPESIKSYSRYQELKEAFDRELENNKTLNLDLSMYTVFATVTNYLSRRLEKSNSSAPEEVQSKRQSTKLEYFDQEANLVASN